MWNGQAGMPTTPPAALPVHPGNINRRVLTALGCVVAVMVVAFIAWLVVGYLLSHQQIYSNISTGLNS